MKQELEILFGSVLHDDFNVEGENEFGDPCAASRGDSRTTLPRGLPDAQRQA
jgi:hypothetical protein